MSVCADPRWLAALALLLLNDHLLKGLAASGALPHWLTGKLSDVAGVVVAVGLGHALGAMLGGGRVSGRAGGAALALLPFVAINSSVELAAAYDAALYSLGLPSHTWSDPTDLLALAALPLGWWIAARPRPIGRRSLQTLGTGAGALGCVATSWAGDSASPPALVNASNAELAVAVQLARPGLTCVDLAQTSKALAAADFEPADALVLPPGWARPLFTVLPSDQEWPFGCGAAVLSLGSALAPVLVTWDESVHFAASVSSTDETPSPGGIYLQLVDSQVVLTVGGGLVASPAPPELQP